MTAAHHRRRWFRFGLRTILAVELVIGVFAALVTYETTWMLDRQRAVRYGVARMGGEAIRGPFPLWIFGETGRTAMIIGIDTESDVQRIRRLFPETAFIEFYQREPTPVTGPK